MAGQANGRDGQGGLASQLPVDRLRDEATELGRAVIEKWVSSAGDKVVEATDRLNDVASGGGGKTAKKMAKNVAQGDSPAKAAVKAGSASVMGKVKDKVKQAFGGGSGKGKLKVTNIVEEIDVPTSRTLAYNKWTQFQEMPSYTKKLEHVEQEEDEQLQWKAQIFWSHRTWQSTIVEQVPDERIKWRSSGEKGHVDGVVTFHELTPDLTRILLTLEYHPKGFFEQTGNLWRAQGRRVRLELKHFRRELANNVLLNPDEVEGWRGEIRDEETVKSDAQRRREEQGSTGSQSRRGGQRSSGRSTGRRQQKRSSGATKSTASKRSASGRPGTTRRGSKAAKAQPAKRSGTASRTAAARKSSTTSRAQASPRRRPAKKTTSAASRARRPR